MENGINTIDDALDKIYSYVDYSMTHAEDITSAVFSLNRIRSLLEKLGNPQDDFQSIHVAGTKGKGSVCTMIYEALLACGYQTGIYTSPHLIRFNERIQTNGKMISDADLISVTKKVIDAVDPEQPPSTFDLMTAIALMYFKEKKVDFAIIETGLGGRLDSTNVIKPVITAITSISMDHMNFLGNSIEKITEEKGGIIMPGVPVVADAGNPISMAILKSIAEEKHAEWIDVESTYGCIPTADSDSGQQLMLWKRSEQEQLKSYLEGKQRSEWQPWSLSVPLAGHHQSRNAMTAFAVLMRLKPIADKINSCCINEGIAKTFWPCRFEKISSEPLIILDGAHNADSMENLVQTLNRYYGTDKTTCVLGCSEDKDIQHMVREIAPFVTDFIVTRSVHPRSMNPEKIYDAILCNGRSAVLSETLEDALSEMDKKGRAGRFIVTGSLFVTGGFRELLMARDPEIKYFTIDQ